MPQATDSLIAIVRLSSVRVKISPPPSLFSMTVPYELLNSDPTSNRSLASVGGIYNGSMNFAIFWRSLASVGGNPKNCKIHRAIENGSESDLKATRHGITTLQSFDISNSCVSKPSLCSFFLMLVHFRPELKPSKMTARFLLLPKIFITCYPQ